MTHFRMQYSTLSSMLKLLTALFLGLLISFTPVLGLAQQSMVDLEIPISGGLPLKQISIQGHQLRFKYIQSASAKGLRLRTASDFSSKYLVNQLNTTGLSGPEAKIEIIRNTAKSKADYAQVSSSVIEDMEVYGPSSVSLAIFIFEGSIQVANFDGKLEASVTKGKINLKAVRGAQKIYVNKGDVLVEQSSGQLNADANTGTMTIREFEGPLKIENFGSELSIEKGSGDLQLTQFQGNSKISARTGDLRIEQNKGNAVVQAPIGSVEAQLGEAVGQFYLKPESENIQIKSKSGRVTVVVPDGLAVPVNLATVEGDLLVPPAIDKQRFGSGKSVRATFPGATKSKTSVFVRTVEASIILR